VSCLGAISLASSGDKKGAKGVVGGFKLKLALAWLFVVFVGHYFASYALDAKYSKVIIGVLSKLFGG